MAYRIHECIWFINQSTFLVSFLKGLSDIPWEIRCSTYRSSQYNESKVLHKTEVTYYLTPRRFLKNNYFDTTLGASFEILFAKIS